MNGEGNCIFGPRYRRATGNIASAQARWREALALYAKIPQPYAIGFAHRSLARYAATPEEAAEHRDAAGRAWASIDRQDLIEKYLGGSA